jgi:ATP-dependent Clp protease, protease subunit
MMKSLSPESRKAAGFWGWDSAIKAETETLTIRVYDVIGSGFFGGFGAEDMAKILDENKGVKNIEVRFNTPGGDVFDGIAMMNLLRQSKAKVTGFVDGYAASAGTIVAMGCAAVHMGPSAFWMVHEPWTVVMGNRRDMRETASFLDKVTDAIVDEYTRFTGADRKHIAGMVSAETWLSAQEAVDEGFAKSVVDVEAPENSADARATAQVIAALKTFAATCGVTAQAKEKPMPQEEPKATVDVAAIQASNASLQAQVVEMTATSKQLREDLLAARTDAHNSKAEAAKAQADLSALAAKTAALEDRVVKQEVSALVGDKIAANEVDDFVALAKSNPTLFASMVEKRASLRLTERIVTPENKPGESRPAEAATTDGSAEFANL